MTGEMRLAARRRLGILLALQLLLAATAAAPAAAQIAAAGPGRASAEAVGLDAAALEAAVGLYREAVAADELRGAVLLVARRGTIVLHEAVGWRDREAGMPMEANTLFRMASNTKPVIAAAALMLEEEGRLSMADPVSRHIPGFGRDALRGITVHHLATHSSGLPRSPIFLRGVSADSDLRREAERFAEALEPERPAGSEYGYSNAAYNVLGGVIEAASGMPLEDFLRQRLYEPLGMLESSNHESRADAARMSKVYRRSGGEWRAGWSPTDGPDYPIARASGGMISTAEDYARFLHAFLGGGRLGDARILSEASVRRATSALVPAGEGGYGYGWQVSRDGVFSHTGSDGTAAYVDPGRGLVVLVFTQSPDGRNPRAEFLRRVQAAVID
jgi:CubicO group peptidase (beta-lactamase class C family)